MTNAVATTEAERAVLTAIDQWLKGTMTADAEALDRVLAPDYTYTHASSAAVDSRDVWLESFRTGGRRYQVYAIHDVRLRSYPGVVVLSGKAHQEMNPNGEQRELNTAFQSVWVPIDGEWRVVAWQATRLAEPQVAQ